LALASILWRRRGRIAFLGLGIALYFLLAPKAPNDQRLRLRLGDTAPGVSEVRVRSRSAGSADGDWEREVTFHYAKGQAPRIVSYEPRLANGDYLVEIELKTDDSPALVTDRRVKLEGNSTTIDLSQVDSTSQTGRTD
jgi:hypothetical protein